jgi:hypothetical protein
MKPKLLLNHRPEENNSDEETKARFGTAIGSLMYLMVGTRPDIAFALGTLSGFTSRPQSHHQAALQRRCAISKPHSLIASNTTTDK